MTVVRFIQLFMRAYVEDFEYGIEGTQVFSSFRLVSPKIVYNIMKCIL